MGFLRVFGVAAFIVGIASLAVTAIRRGRNAPVSAMDHWMMFLGIAGTITGLAVIFMRFN